MSAEAGQRLALLLSELFLLPVEQVTDDLSKDTVEMWDSLNHLELVLALETEFDVTLSTDEILEMVNYPIIKAILREHGITV